jgi:hypothetical protein
MRSLFGAEKAAAGATVQTLEREVSQTVRASQFLFCKLY